MSLAPIESMLSLVSTNLTSHSPSSKILQKQPRSYSQSPPLPTQVKSSMKQSFENESLVKNQYRLQLQNHHPILRSFVAVDKEEASLRDDSSYNKSFKRISAAIKFISNGKEDKDKLATQIIENLPPIKKKIIRSQCKSVDLAYEKWREEENMNWANKKGVKLSFQMSKGFLDFLSDLFEALDEDHNNSLSPDEFILPLLAYGVTTEPVYIEKALMHIFGSTNLNSMKIEKNKFIELFRDDSRTDRLLNALQLHTKQLLVAYEEKKMARRKSLGLAFRSETRIEDVVPRVYCTIEEFIAMIKSWWKDMIGTKNKNFKFEHGKVHKSVLLELLVKKQLVLNNIEAIRVINTLDKGMGLFSYDIFEKIFLKAMMKSALMNLALGLNNSKFAGSDSLAIRLARCQRKFMVSGVSMKNNEISIQGRKALNAAGKYQQEHQLTSRIRTMENVKAELKKVESENEENLRGYLYMINESAKEFLDDWGNICTNYKNTWEIRDHIKNKNEKH